MLDALRAASQSWFGRILFGGFLGVIIIAFGYWGTGDVFRNFGANQLARVGSVDIGVETYRDAYRRALQELQQQMGQAITNEQARQFGLDRQVLSHLVSESLLDQESARLGLAMSDKELAQAIVDDPRFKGPGGKFDRQQFNMQLQNAGMTERRFTDELRGEFLRREQVVPLQQGLELPNVLLEAMNRYTNETRSIDYIILPASAAGEIAPPTPEALKTFYDARRDLYRTPEYRKIVVLSLSPAELAKTITVSDADLEKRYDEVKATRYSEPERRSIEQIVFPDEASAKAAADKIAAGETFDAIAAERKLTQKDIELGTVAKSALIEKPVADAAFALAEGAVSPPVKTQFGWALLRVTKIEPAGVKPFEEVKADLEKELKNTRARDAVSKLHDQIEDRRSAGKTLAEAAAGTGLSPRTIDAVDAKGTDKDGKAVADLPDPQALLKAVFASDIGVDNEPIDTRDGGTVWFEVAGIEPARQQTLEEVKPLVEKAWLDDERNHRLVTKAADIVKKIQGGEKLEAIAAAEGNLEVKHDGSVKRSGGAGLAQNAVVQVFNVPVGGAGTATTEGGRMIFQVLDASVQPIDEKSADFAKLGAQVKEALGNDLVSEYLEDLQNRMGVNINQRALQTVLGSPADGQ